MFALLLSIATLLSVAAAEPSLRGPDGFQETLGKTPIETTPATQGHDPVAQLRVWLKLAHEGRAGIDKRSIGELRNTIGDLRTLWSLNPPRGDEIALVLLDLLGFTLSSYDSAQDEEDTLRLSVRTLAADALNAHNDAALRDMLARKILALPRSQPIERRIAAAYLALGTRPPEMKLALFGCARESDPRLRSIALEALSGWEDDGVHALFLNELSQWLAGKLYAEGRTAEQHFKTAKIPNGSRVQTELAAIVKSRLASSDWRAVSQAVALSTPLEHAAIVPWLIEALAEWKKRADVGAQGLRIQFEILHALELRSGRQLGPAPDKWREWWTAVQKGEVRGQSPRTTGGGIEPTRVSFFGLKPNTDRVTFVIDSSGSMDTPFGKQPTGTHPKRHTRWEEAVGQLLDFVEAIGDKGRFNIVLFHDYAEVWKPKLADINKENRKAAREWLNMHRPGGGTQLRAGVERAMMVDAAGGVDIAMLEADTVIILCDGATAEGPEWVPGFLKNVNAVARVVFDCVQLGNEGDGTLQRLARGSGGEFVQIDG